MSKFSNYLEDQITNWLNGQPFATTLTGGVFVQLFSSDPGETGVLTGALFTRINVPAGGFTRGTGGAGTLTNTNIITITSNNTGGSVTASHVGVFNAVTSGELLFYGALTASKTIATGDEVKFNANQLTLTID
jgi:hypothetical protein